MNRLRAMARMEVNMGRPLVRSSALTMALAWACAFTGACSSNDAPTPGASAATGTQSPTSGSSADASLSGSSATGSSGAATGSSSGVPSGASAGAASGTVGPTGSNTGAGTTGSSGGASTGSASGADTGSPTDASVTPEASNSGSAGGNPQGGNAGPPTDSTTRAKCTGTSPIVCHLGGNPGNYAVTVELGGASASETEIEAETSRSMLGYVTTAAGAPARYSFVVNVRQPEGQPVENVGAGTPGLDLYFYGPHGAPGEDASPGGSLNPAVTAIGTAAATNPVMIYVAGDSTTCDQTDVDFSGWAQMVPRYFDYPVSIANYADSGESSFSFYGNAKMWGAIKALLKAGDWVVIQFGHNDKTDYPGEYEAAMNGMINDAKAKGAKPLLVTPPSHTIWTNGVLDPALVHPLYAQSDTKHTTVVGQLDIVATMKSIAKTQAVPLVDLEGLSQAWYQKLGPNGWQAYHAPGSSGWDATHTNREGALALAGMVAQSIRDQNLPLATYVRGPIPPPPGESGSTGASGSGSGSTSGGMTGATGSTTSPGVCPGGKSPNPDVTTTCNAANAMAGAACTENCCIACGIANYGTETCTCSGGKFASCVCPVPANWSVQSGLCGDVACSTAGGPCSPGGYATAETAPAGGVVLQGAVCVQNGTVCFTQETDGRHGCLCTGNGDFTMQCGLVNDWFTNNGQSTMY